MQKLLPIALLLLATSACSGSDGENNSSNNANNTNNTNNTNNNPSVACPEPGAVEQRWAPGDKPAVVTFAVPEGFVAGTDRVDDDAASVRQTVYSKSVQSSGDLRSYFMTFSQTLTDVDQQKVDMETVPGELFPGSGINRTQVAEIMLGGEAVKVMAYDYDDKTEVVLFPKVGGANKEVRIQLQALGDEACQPKADALAVAVARSIQLAP